MGKPERFENHGIDSSLLLPMYKKELLRQLEEMPKFWKDAIDAYRVPDTRPWWRKMLNRLYWKTIGRFKNWLHRDCGDY